ncbi:MAG: autotransporter outer membrane beta-barrel domain-containing protein [Thermodesulfobacteriota bacterium]|nr:autotransporter outer membrane beta-barrel domain-containing protein [Thermodesulfobacteriota bacterium]
MNSKINPKRGMILFTVALVLTCLLAFTPDIWATPSCAPAGGTNDTREDGSGEQPRPFLVRTSGQNNTKLIRGRIGALTGPVEVVNAPNIMLGSNGTVGVNLLDNMSGLSSGDKGNKWGIWMSGAWTDLENDLSSTAFDGDLFLYMAGLDYMFTDKFLVGFAVGLEWSNLDTAYNNGTLDSNGFTVSPYAAYLFNDYLSADLIVSYTVLDYEETRSGGSIGGSYNAERFMVSTGVNYHYLMDNWNFGAGLGYMYSNEDVDRFIESNGTVNNARDTDLGEVRFGGRVGYFFNKFEPYFSAYYIYDVSMEEIIVAPNQEQPDNDRDEVETAIGLNYTPTDSIRCGLEVAHSFAREDFDSTSVLLNLRWEF